MSKSQSGAGNKTDTGQTVHAGYEYSGIIFLKPQVPGIKSGAAVIII